MPYLKQGGHPHQSQRFVYFLIGFMVPKEVIHKTTGKKKWEASMGKISTNMSFDRMRRDFQKKVGNRLEYGKEDRLETAG